MQLHQRGVDLLVNVQDAADHVDSLTRDDIHKLLREVSVVLGELLDRHVPFPGQGSGRLETQGWRREGG